MRELSSSKGRRLSVGTSKIALTLGLCLCAGQLAATPAAAATAAPATAVSPATVKAATASGFSAVAAQQALTVTAQSKVSLAKAKVVKAKASKGAKVLAEAKKHTGARYRYGASGPRVFDCSGFTKYVYKKAAGKNLPHKAHSQQGYGRAIAKSKAQPGDLIVIRSGSRGTHAGVYAGGGYMYDSPRAGKTVGKHKIWSRNYVVRRLV